MEKYKKLNTYIGWFIFLVATIVYFATVESTVSLWDCGEYITAAYKLEVGHPPGAPLFMLLGRLFSFFASPENVAVYINRMSALSSSGTILFMFWSITMLVKKMIFKQYNKRTLTAGEMIAILGSGIVGSLIYTFTDSFWFSAVEGEVYAMSSLFTAVIFWAILKWDEEMDAIKFNEIDSNQNSLKWLVLIMFFFGLAIGVHLLGLLVVPAIAYVIFFNQVDKVSVKNFFITGIISLAVLGGIQNGIIPGTIAIASSMEIFFVNSLGMPFYSGAIFFVLLCVAAFIFLIRYAIKNDKKILHASVLGLLVLLLGYGAFATIVIRSNADTPLDENDPENLVTLQAYLMREQYGSWPLLTGPYWNSQKNDPNMYEDGNAKHVRRFVAVSGDTDIKAFKHKKDAEKFADTTKQGYEIVEKYYVHNKSFLEHSEVTYAQTTFFPRMWWTNADGKVEGYKKWSGYNPGDVVDSDVMGADGARLPRFSENMRYFVNYQLDWMYFRYFMWNFTGRQNDIQGHGDEMRGNWLSGVKFIDQMRLGAQGVDSPSFTFDNEGYNRYFFLPLILGLIGLIFHFYRAPKDAFVVLLTFLFTGLAIVVYLNQKPFEPRERDYAYAASFYAFAMWTGIAIYALFDIIRNFGQKEIKKTGIIIGTGVLVFGISGLGAENGFSSLMTWLFIAAVSVALIGLMLFFRKIQLNEKTAAGAITALALFVPILMGFQNWDDHDRSSKTTALDLAHNYLESCLPNAILFTNGDNDTFPLWYYQEVEGKRTDVRVCNLSLLGTDWYSEQMTYKVYNSEPLPIKFTSDQILSFDGGTEQVFLYGLFELTFLDVSQAQFKKFYDVKYKYNKAKMNADYASILATYREKFASLKIKQASSKITTIQKILNNESATEATAENVYQLFASFKLLVDCMRDGSIEDPAQNNATVMAIQDVIRGFEQKPNTIPLDEAMAFTRNDNNMIRIDAYNSSFRIIPGNSFSIKVNKENVLKSGLVNEKNKNKIVDEVTFTLTKQYVTKEQVMMLDILANNDWKRPIFFSSNYGSDVSIALFQEGFVKQVGVAFELIPVKGIYTSGLNEDRMYDNLMKTYNYGKMNQGALTDYYARRHTVQYRNNFIRLAELYLNSVENNNQQIKSFETYIANPAIPAQQKDSLRTEIAKMQDINTKNKTKAEKLLDKCLEVMPIEMVLDYGEQPQEVRPIQVGQLSVDNYIDGTIQNIVTMMYRTGNKAKADKVATQVFDILSRNINYFMKSKATIMYYNKRDLIASLNGLFAIDMIANDANEGNPQGAIAKKINSYIEQFTQKDYPRKLAELKDMADNAGEAYSDLYLTGYNEMKQMLPALMSTYGYQVEGMPQGGSGASQDLTPEQIQQLIQNQE